MADELGITTASPAPPTQPAAAPATPAPTSPVDPIQEAEKLGGPLGSAAIGGLVGAAQHENTSPPAQPTGKTVRMVRPDGLVGEVPEEKASEAAQHGYRTVVQMTNPKGEVGNVPVEKSHDALSAGYKFGMPIRDTSSMSAAPSVDASDVAKALISTPSLNKVNDAINNAITNIENYTPQGREEHPILAQVGDLVRTAKNLLFGQAADSTNPFAMRMSNAGLVNNPLTQTMALAAGGPEAAAEAEDAVVGKVKGVANAAKAKIGDVMEDWFKPTDVPKPQHGTPVSVESLLDRATVNSLPNGKELSDQAFKTLQSHVGDKIPVGSTNKNMMMKAVEPVQKAIADTGVKMAKVVDSAPAFKTSVMDDANATGPFIAKSATGEGVRQGWQGRDFVNSLASETETGILKDIADIRENLPLKGEDPLNKVVDVQMQAAEKALNSTDPREILNYRRKLGKNIQWGKDWGPDTAGKIADQTMTKIYHALGNKLKTEIPEVAELDKVFSPNLELQGYMDEKLGKAVSRNPAEATAQQLSEHAKGKAALESEAHNARVRQNVATAKKALGYGVAGAAGAAGATAIDYMTK